MNQVTKTVLIIGSSGQVGKGILQSFNSSKTSWKIIAIDPQQLPDQESYDKVQFINRSWECISDDELARMLLLNTQSMDHPCYLEACYTADEGNRDVYSEKIGLGEENNRRFELFLQRLYNLMKKTSAINNTKVHVSYCGGSWTRRKVKNDSDFIISDNSTVKEKGGDNMYEKAKTSAYNNTEQLYNALNCKDWCSITFYDYISVVPNYSPNFTIHKMIQQGLVEGSIMYSIGDYGRPLLHSRQAGDILQLYSEHLSTSTHNQFNLILIPGCFTKFESFATICREEILKQNAKDIITFKHQESTPDFLKTKCDSKFVKDVLLVEPDLQLVLDGLRDTAMYSIQEKISSLKQESK